MELSELILVSHTDQYVIYDGYIGQDQAPDFIVKTNAGLVTLLKQYGSRQVSCIEAVDVWHYVWLYKEDPFKVRERVIELLKYAVDKIRNDEDCDETTRKVLLDIGFLEDEINELLD
jgi:hypothetical protein